MKIEKEYYEIADTFKGKNRQQIATVLFLMATYFNIHPVPTARGFMATLAETIKEHGPVDGSGLKKQVVGDEKKRVKT